MNPAPCSSPLDAEILADYWLADLPADRQASVEEHLFACEPCSRRLNELIALGRAVRSLTRQGVLRTFVSPAFLERLAADGLRVRQYQAPAGGGVACTVTAGDDVVAARLAADLAAARRVDLAFCDAGGREQLRLQDVPVAPPGAEVCFTEPVDVLRRLPASVTVFRLIAVEPAGERCLGEFTFRHTPSPNP